ncbi:MAG: OPT/YSL family transporter [Candidatus Hermodarchaeota archaeon]
MPIKSVYRKPLTPDCIRKMEEGTLDYFDEVYWSNFNTGAMEQYLDEKTRIEGFQRSKWRWKTVILGIFLSCIFVFVSMYVGLKVGIVSGGAGFILYWSGLVLKWHPTDIDISSKAGGGAVSTITGFVFVFPAIYLLMFHPRYEVMDADGNIVHLVSADIIPPIAVVMICTMLGALLGVLYFIVFRRIWIVEDPLPCPGFEKGIKMMEIVNDRSRGAMQEAIKSLKVVLKWAMISIVFTFFRDFPVSQNKSTLDNVFGGDYYNRGTILHPYATYTSFAWVLSPIPISTGWFMRFRLALLVTSGSIFVWFVIVPMAVGFNVPIWIPKAGEYFAVRSFPIITPDWEVNQAPAIVAARRVAQPMAIGCILGSGLTGLIKTSKVFKTAIKDIIAVRTSKDKRSGFVEGKGWFEWPITHIRPMILIVIIGVTLMFTLVGQFPLPESLIIGIILVIATFILGAVGVKVRGETGTAPTSGLSIVVLILYITIFKLIGTDTSTMIIMALIGTTVFCTAIALCDDIIINFKGSLYYGTRPYHIVKGNLTAIPFGVITATIGAVILSIGLSTIDPNTGEPILNLEAPQAHAFATFTQLLIGQAPWDWLLIGLGIGIFVELMTGMGTAFGLGMYLPFSLTINFLIGGSLRDWWQKKKFEPKAERLGWTESQKTLKLLHTFMIFTGIGVGEALMGTVIAFYIIIPLII